jgi:phosphatidate cytidylyltransferase
LAAAEVALPLAPKSRARTRRERLGVGGLLAGGAALAVWLDGPLFWGLIAATSVLAWREWARLHRGLAARLAGMVYIAAPAAALVWLRGQPGGLWLALWLFAIVWAADVGAFAVGRALGGARLCPAVSPGKTWAGFWGANISATLASLALADRVGLTPGKAAFAGLALGLLAQAGDLFESWLKRRAGVKDSGTLLAAHGGVLDRLDSLVPVAPAVAGGVALGWL